jgi:uncharacterized membrane protein YcjF (UPF0283 family)
MNKKSDPIEVMESRFDTWLQANEVPESPPAAFKQRMHERMSNNAALARVSEEAGAEVTIHHLRSRWSFWLAGAAAVAAVLTVVVALQAFLLTDSVLASEPIWRVVEFELYAALLEPIDAEVLAELAELLDFY